MTRRDLIQTPFAVAIRATGALPLLVPVHRIIDARAHLQPAQLQRFWTAIWPEAYRVFQRGGIELKTTDSPGEVRRSAADRPLFTGLRRAVINLILTDHLPLYWDNSRALAGGTSLWNGYSVCLIALRYAHGNRVPFLSTNTCVHELMHALLLDIFVSHPFWYQSAEREARIDWYATLLWLFHDGHAIRQSAQECLRRLQSFQ